VAQPPGRARWCASTPAVPGCGGNGPRWFGIDSFNDFVVWVGAPDARLDVALRVALPLGISLYILQSLSYVIDVYRGHSTAMKLQ
jgi:D-alanyl-lipoteichoic acid acyltransferase DltB (MBOAT superfamily)